MKRFLPYLLIFVLSFKMIGCTEHVGIDVEALKEEIRSQQTTVEYKPHVSGA